MPFLLFNAIHVHYAFDGNAYENFNGKNTETTTQSFTGRILLLLYINEESFKKEPKCSGCNSYAMTARYASSNNRTHMLRMCMCVFVCKCCVDCGCR